MTQSPWGGRMKAAPDYKQLAGDGLLFKGNQLRSGGSGNGDRGSTRVSDVLLLGHDRSSCPPPRRAGLVRAVFSEVLLGAVQQPRGAAEGAEKLLRLRVGPARWSAARVRVGKGHGGDGSGMRVPRCGATVRSLHSLLVLSAPCLSRSPSSEWFPC